MARLDFKNNSETHPDKIALIMAEQGLGFEVWGLKSQKLLSDSECLQVYKDDINKLKAKGHYQSADVVALNPDTQGLDSIIAKFSAEHHHSEDEVRFTVAGSGVFEIASKNGDEMLKFLAEPGDLIVIPAGRRHLFYLTDEKTIRCIRLFQDPKGWQAIY